MNFRGYTLAATAVLSGLVPALKAETYTFSAVNASGIKTPAPLYVELSPSWRNENAVHSTVSPGKYARGTTNQAQNAQWRISPTLAIPGGTYVLQITHGSAAAGSQDVVVNISVTGATLTDSGGSPVSSTTVFRQPGANTWETVGTLKLDAAVTQPTLTFTTQMSPAYTGRIYVDGFQFTSVGGCESGLPRIEAVKGPLAAGQTQVAVPNVAAGATRLVVYANGVNIGERDTGVVEGENLVTVAPLVKGQEVIATQLDASGVESCKAPVGGIVGGGANPNVRVVLNIIEDISNWPFFLGSGDRVGDAGSAPSGGKVITPGPCWQTVSFQRGVDPSYCWTCDNPYDLEGDYATFDGIGLALEANDNGPYLVVIDNIMNGDVLIQDFETETGEGFFAKPSTSATTASYLMPVSGPPSPDIGTVVNGVADSGSNSFAVNWQFKDLSTSNWLLLQTGGSGTPQPVVDLRLPISFRILLLPVGVQAETGPIITDPPPNATVASGDDAVFHVSATGTAPLSYQWFVNGIPAGTDIPMLTIPDVTRADHGTRVSVAVCDATGSTRSADAVLTVPCRPFFADVDLDGDVDQSDFGEFQACFSGMGVGAVGDCLCFDHDPAGLDGDVDGDDLKEFQKCATGPMVLWTVALPADCRP